MHKNAKRRIAAFPTMRHNRYLNMFCFSIAKDNDGNTFSFYINSFVVFSSQQSSPIGTTIFRNILAQDKDAGVNGLVEYFLVDSSKNLLHSNDTVSVADGHGVFAISYPHQGQVSVPRKSH